MSNEKISLSFTDGSSDKVYQAELKEVNAMKKYTDKEYFENKISSLND